MPTTLAPGRRMLIAALVAASVAAASGPSGRLALAMPLALLAPGYLVERVAARPRPPLLIRLALWLGLSLSLIALGYQWAWAAGLALSDLALWVGTGLLALVALGAVWRDLGGTTDLGQPPDAAQRWSLVFTGVIFLVTLALRLSDIAELELPPWVDSVHHALMIRVAAETGMAPSSLMPYLPVTELPYHWGYHVIIATLLRLSGLGLPETMLLTGQVLNALHSLCTASLALALWRRPLAAPVAALVVGLISLMPAYYLSWGRYTQLTGLLLLPALIISWRGGLAGHGRGWWVMAALTLAGLSLIHFRVLIFGGALVVATTIVWGVSMPWAKTRQQLIAAGTTSIGAALLTTPWLAQLAARALLPALSNGGLAGGGSYNALDTTMLWITPNRLLVALALGAAWIGLRRRDTAVAIMLLWVGLLVLGANPWLLSYLLASGGVALLSAALIQRRPMIAALGGILLVGAVAGAPPYLWLITNDVVMISLFIPLAVLIAGGAALLHERLTRFGPRVATWLIPAWAITLTAAGTWGVMNTRGSILNHTTLLAGHGDLTAIAWVAEHTPPDARFLINAAAWLPAARRGVDGGWWLMPLTGRWTSTPPVLASYGEPAYLQHVNAVGDNVINYTPGGEQAILDLIAAEGITYIYLTEGKGPLTPELFVGRPGFRVVYVEEGVTIVGVQVVGANPDKEATLSESERCELYIASKTPARLIAKLYRASFFALSQPRPHDMIDLLSCNKMYLHD